LANIKSAKKRILVTEKKTLRNKARKSEMKTYIKRFEALLNEGKFDEAKEALKKVDKKLKKAADKNVIHKNAASRKLGRLQLKLNKAMKTA